MMIMKKILLFAAACLLSLGITAQTITTLGSIKAERSTAAFQAPEMISSHRALAENQYLCGYYTTDELSNNSYGMGYYTSGVCKAATDFGQDIYGSYTGFKVVGMRVGLCYQVTDFGVFISKVNNSGNITDFKEKSVGTGDAGWNTVMFDESDQFELPTDGTTFLVGFNYYQKAGQTDACYPISYLESSAKKGVFLFYGNIPASYGGSGLGWYNLGEDGALSVQLIIEGELAGQKTVIEGLNTEKFGKVGSEFKGVLSITNLGKESISKLGFNYYIDDAKVGDATVEKTIASTATENVNIAIPIPADMTVGQHTVKVELTTVNGAAPTGEIVNNNTTSTFTAYVNCVDRQKQLIEHITSWTCTYCYLGYNLLRQMEQQYNDVAWVAIHGNQSSQQDPYYFATCDEIMYYLGVSSFPSASFNRTYMPELAEVAGEITYSIGYYEQYISQLVPYIHDMMVETNSPSFVTLNVQSSFDASTRNMQVTVKGTGVEKAAQLMSGNNIYIYVTEAGLKGRQLSNGKWESSFDHNNTLRAVLTDAQGDNIIWDGNNFTFTTSYTVPADYKEENLSIVAFVAPKPSSDTMNMAVNNCEKAQLDLTPTAISTVNSNNATETVRYTLDGRQISAPQHGLNIIKMSDGTVRKVVVK